MDVIFGDLGGFLERIETSGNDVVSAAPDRLAGHLTVFRNTAGTRMLFSRIRGWRQILGDPSHRGMDEGALTTVAAPKKRHFMRRLIAPPTLFEDLAATPGGVLRMPDGARIPDLWTWRDGMLTHAQKPAGTEYLHMMYWQSDRWHPPGSVAPWPRLPKVVRCDWREAAEHGFSISPEGIRLLSS